MIKLSLKALMAFLLGLIIMGTLLFLPAGTLAYRGAWLFIALLFIPILVVGVVLLIKAPDLLRKRLAMKEREKEQQGVVALSGLLLVASLVIAGLDYRFGWSHISSTIVTIAAVVLLVGYGLYAEVLRENAYLSRTIGVQENQKVIDTGLYGMVRHPMYSATVLLFLSMPLVLGSLPSFVIMLVYIPLIAKRIRNEEAILLEGLNGYADYCSRVKYKIIPFIW